MVVFAVPKLFCRVPMIGTQRAVAYADSNLQRPFMTREVLQSSMETENVNRSWYALRVKSRHENTVASHLQARGFSSFLPLYRCRRRWSDRFKEIELPLFPGYVFCQFNALNRFPILSVPGTVHVVGAGKTPVPVEPAEIAAIQAAVKFRLPSQPCPFLRVGQKVRIEDGPLCGVEGILTDFKGHRRLVLSVSLLQRSVAVQVDEACVRPMPQEYLAHRNPQLVN
jgi:transcriptional antiterminator RfaH